MSQNTSIRTLFCIAVDQNFFNLPSKDIGLVWTGFSNFLKGVASTPGVAVLGTLDDDETMVGASPTGFPWTCYVLADCPDREAVKTVCNLFRTIEIGEFRLWRYMRIEARMGRALAIPDFVQSSQ